MALFILPTSGPRTYRGKYPTRVRSVSCGATGLHLELNDGTRLWSYGGGGNFPAIRPGYDFAAHVESAHAMTAEQYATLREAAETHRKPLESSSPADKARERDAKAGTIRRLLESIRPAAPAPAESEFTFVHRMGRVDVWHGDSVANRGTAYGFNSETAARAWLVEYLSNYGADALEREAAERSESCLILSEQTERLPAPATSGGKADGGPEQTERLPAPAPVRRDNVEYHAGRSAYAEGKGRADCPYSAGGERAERWTLGWQEAWAAANPARSHRLAQAQGMAEIARGEQRAAIAETVRTITLAPSWRGMLPAFRALIENSNPEGRRTAWAEIERALALADERNTIAARVAAGTQAARDIRGGFDPDSNARTALDSILSALETGNYGPDAESEA